MLSFVENAQKKKKTWNKIVEKINQKILRSKLII